MKFSWITLIVNNFDETLEFYKDIVGLKLIRKVDTTSEGYRIVFLGDQIEQIEIIENTMLKNISMGRNISIGFIVDSLEDTIKHLETNKIRIHSGPLQPSPNIKFIYVLDPNGLKVQFAQILNT